MPNYITNNLTVYTQNSEPESIAMLNSLIDHVKGEHRDFDLNEVVPRSEELSITAGSITNYAMALYDDNQAREIMSYRYLNGSITTIEAMRAYIRETMPEAISHAEKIKSNIEKYGHPDWYSWSVDKWGTKWNTIECSSEKVSNEEVHYNFLTAWSPPYPVLDFLSKKYPELIFELKFEDEGDGIEHILYWMKGDCYETKK